MTVRFDIGSIKHLVEGAYTPASIRFDRIHVDRTGAKFYKGDDIICEVDTNGSNIDITQDEINILGLKGLLELDIK